jgi:hypothetical protein
MGWRRRRIAARRVGDVSIDDFVGRVVAALGWEGHLAETSETLVVTGGPQSGASIGVTVGLRSLDADEDLEDAVRRIADWLVERATLQVPAVDLSDWAGLAAQVRTAVGHVEDRIRVDGQRASVSRSLARSVADDLVEWLVVDDPTCIFYPGADEAAAWPVSVADAFDAARENVRAREPVRPVLGDELRGTGVVAFGGNDFYTASHAMWLGHVVDVPEDGALLAVPARGVVLARPLDGVAVAPAAIRDLAGIARTLFDTEPRPVSDSVYHVRGHDIRRVAFRSLPGEPTQITLTPHAMRIT